MLPSTHLSALFSLLPLIVGDVAANNVAAGALDRRQISPGPMDSLGGSGGSLTSPDATFLDGSNRGGSGSFASSPSDPMNQMSGGPSFYPSDPGSYGPPPSMGSLSSPPPDSSFPSSSPWDGAYSSPPPPPLDNSFSSPPPLDNSFSSPPPFDEPLPQSLSPSANSPLPQPIPVPSAPHGTTPQVVPACDIVVDGCTCVKPDIKTGSLAQVGWECGIVSRDWNTKAWDKSERRSLIAFDRDLRVRTALADNDASLQPRDPRNVTPMPATMPRGAPSVYNVTDPLLQALNEVYPGEAMQGIQSVVRNAGDSHTHLKWIMGMKGQFMISTTIEGHTFAAGTPWLIRWDLAWYGAKHALPDTGLVGPNVQLVIHDVSADFQIHNRYFALADDPMMIAKDQGNYLMMFKLKPLVVAANYNQDSQKFLVDEHASALALADTWAAYRLKANATPQRNP